MARSKTLSEIQSDPPQDIQEDLFTHSTQPARSAPQHQSIARGGGSTSTSRGRGKGRSRREVLFMQSNGPKGVSQQQGSPPSSRNSRLSSVPQKTPQMFGELGRASGLPYRQRQSQLISLAESPLEEEQSRLPSAAVSSSAMVLSAGEQSQSPSRSEREHASESSISSNSNSSFIIVDDRSERGVTHETASVPYFSAHKTDKEEEHNSIRINAAKVLYTPTVETTKEEAAANPPGAPTPVWAPSRPTPHVLSFPQARVCTQAQGNYSNRAASASEANSTTDAKYTLQMERDARKLMKKQARLERQELRRAKIEAGIRAQQRLLNIPYSYLTHKQVWQIDQEYDALINRDWGSRMLPLLQDVCRWDPKRLSEAKASEWTRKIFSRLPMVWKPDTPNYRRSLADFHEALKVARDSQLMKLQEEYPLGEILLEDCPILCFIGHALRAVEKLCNTARWVDRKEEAV